MSELIDRIDVLPGGRVAEELVYADVSAGAQNDLQRVTDIDRHIMIHYRMSESVVPATFRGTAAPGPVYGGCR